MKPFLPVEGELRVRQGGDAALRGGHAHEALPEEDARHHRHGRSGKVSGSFSSVVGDISNFTRKHKYVLFKILLNNSFHFRRTLKNRILQYDPDQFGTPLPHTSRTKRPEEDNGMRYWFVDREVRRKFVYFLSLFCFKVFFLFLLGHGVRHQEPRVPRVRRVRAQPLRHALRLHPGHHRLRQDGRARPKSAEPQATPVQSRFATFEFCRRALCKLPTADPALSLGKGSKTTQLCSYLSRRRNVPEFMPFVVFLAAPGMEEMKNTFDNARLTNSLINSSRNLANFERNSSIRMSSRRAKTLESISSLYVEEVNIYNFFELHYN